MYQVALISISHFASYESTYTTIPHVRALISGKLCVKWGSSSDPRLLVWSFFLGSWTRPTASCYLSPFSRKKFSKIQRAISLNEGGSTQYPSCGLDWKGSWTEGSEGRKWVSRREQSSHIQLCLLNLKPSGTTFFFKCFNISFKCSHIGLHRNPGFHKYSWTHFISEK